MKLLMPSREKMPPYSRTITYAEALLHCKISLAYRTGFALYDALQHELALLLSWTFPP
jgi:hypothetical protein